MSMTAVDIQRHLQVAFYETFPYQTLNFSRRGYQEADVFMINKSNLQVTEIEVKISLKDYMADFKKAFKHHKMANYRPGLICPSHFYYACPEALIPLAMIPPYAGLIYVMEDGSVEVMKKAPKIHKEPADQKTILAVMENLTAHRIFGCQYLTHLNRMANERSLAYERERIERTQRFIEFSKTKKEE